jgi:hypothetical protein
MGFRSVTGVRLQLLLSAANPIRTPPAAQLPRRPQQPSLIASFSFSRPRELDLPPALKPWVLREGSRDPSSRQPPPIWDLFRPCVRRTEGSSRGMDRRGDIRKKRKQPASPTAADRPEKQLRPVARSLDDLRSPSRQAQPMMMDLDSDAGSSAGSGAPDDGPLMPIAGMGRDTVEWQATIESVIRNVVSIRFCQTCPFDTDSACASEATGFVVDAERGYILTNRHVVCAGPFWGYCIFDNHEEVWIHTYPNLLAFFCRRRDVEAERACYFSVTCIRSIATLFTILAFSSSILRRSGICR